jgi:hypothetical protein
MFKIKYRIMASIRVLKKDIDFLIFEVISDCFVYGGLHPDNKTEEVSGIISEAVSLRNDLIDRVNNPSGKHEPKLLRAHYKAVKADLAAGVDKLFDRLSALSKK